MDKKAKDILFQTYWKNGYGWLSDSSSKTDPADFAYAKEKGLMFDPMTISHDDCIKRIIEISNKIAPDQIAKAFLSSLSTRRLEWRSGIASYHIAKLFTAHTYTPVTSGFSYEDGKLVDCHHTCSVCQNLKYGIWGHQFYENMDLSVLNFERIKWGGVRHGDLIYTLFDLEQFVKEEITEPTKIDIEIFKGILDMIDSSQHGDYPTVLRNRIKDVPYFKSNKDERSMILEILACIDILKPATDNRPSSKNYWRNDWRFVEFWRGEDKYNKEAVEFFFGKEL